LLSSGLGTDFWDECYQTASDVGGFIPAETSAGWMTPNEFLFNEVPNATHLRVWGCKAYVTLPRDQQRKDLSGRANVGWFMGYSSFPIGWRILMVATTEIIVSTNVTFDEAVPSRSASYFAELDKMMVPVDPIARELQAYQYLVNTVHIDDEDHLMYRVTRVGVWGKQRFIVGWRALEIPGDSAGRELKRSIHIADIARMYHQTQGSIAYLMDFKDIGGVTSQADESDQLMHVTGLDETLVPREGPKPCVTTNKRSDTIGISYSPSQFSSSKNLDVTGRERHTDEVERPDVNPHLEVSDTRDGDIIGNKSGYFRISNDNYSLKLLSNSLTVDEQFIANIEMQLTGRDVPNNHDEAMVSADADQWLEAELRERASLEEFGVLGPVTKIPTGVKVADCRWVYTWKDMSSGKYLAKARVALRDFARKGGVDLSEIYAPTGKNVVFRLLMVLVLLLGLTIHQMDVKTAFLHAPIDEIVYMRAIPGDNIPMGYGYQLRRSLYGYRKAPRNWYKMLIKVFAALGLVQSVLDPCFFWMQTACGMVFVMMHVDDLLIAGHLSDVLRVKQWLHNHFQMKDMGELKKFLNLQVNYVPRQFVEIQQTGYAVEILNRFAEWVNIFPSPRQVPLPADAYARLESNYVPEKEEELNWWKSFPYLNMIGSLLYLSLNTRPDLAFAIGLLARYARNPTFGACGCLAHVLSYISGTCLEGIKYTYIDLLNIIAFCDADWAADRKQRRSTVGYVLMCLGGPLTWGSKLMKTIATSTMQAEYQGFYYCLTDCMFINNFLKELKIPLSNKIMFLTDAESAYRAALNPAFHSRTRHFELVYYLNRVWLGDTDKAIAVPGHVGTAFMIADLLTKPLIASIFIPFRDRIMGHVILRVQDVLIQVRLGNTLRSEYNGYT
jgi:hypothetical protein